MLRFLVVVYLFELAFHGQLITALSDNSHKVNGTEYNNNETINFPIPHFTFPSSVTTSTEPSTLPSSPKTTTPDTNTTKYTTPSSITTTFPTSTTTVSPPDIITPTPSHLSPPSDRKFDGFSFLGGFCLALGLVAIGFLGWKFYVSRQDNVYHTL